MEDTARRLGGLALDMQLEVSILTTENQTDALAKTLDDM